MVRTVVPLPSEGNTPRQDARNAERDGAYDSNAAEAGRIARTTATLTSGGRTPRQNARSAQRDGAYDSNAYQRRQDASPEHPQPFCREGERTKEGLIQLILS
jgi:hypothetical protein